MDKNTLWVLTSAYNDYDQHGEYFIAAFRSRPSASDIEELIGVSFDTAAFIAHHGGGRQARENQWYTLNEVEYGTRLDHA